MMPAIEVRMPGPDKRRHPRKKTRARVLLKSRWQLAPGTGVDVSLGGVLVETAQPFNVGDDVELAIDLPDNSRLNCSGRVLREVKQRTMRVAGIRYGIQITKIDDAAAARLKAWLDRLPA